MGNAVFCSENQQLGDRDYGGACPFGSKLLMDAFMTTELLHFPKRLLQYGLYSNERISLTMSMFFFGFKRVHAL